jgi:hypothetical protein
MKKIIVSTLLLLSVLMSTFACEKEASKDDINVNTNPIIGNKMKIKIGKKTYIATLYTNKTTEVLKALLPLNLDMTDLNSNEKKFDLSVNLPTNIEEIGTIHEGDLLLWGDNTIVLFYKGFNTIYKYTKIGKIDDATGLAESVGSGDVTISFEL